MVTREHTRDGQVRRFTITRGSVGWDLREERDTQIVWRATYTDWHRVERALRVFDLKDEAEPYSTNR